MQPTTSESSQRGFRENNICTKQGYCQHRAHERQEAKRPHTSVARPSRLRWRKQESITRITEQHPQRTAHLSRNHHHNPGNSTPKTHMLTGQNDAEETKASVGPHTPEWGGGGGERGCVKGLKVAGFTEVTTCCALEWMCVSWHI